VPGSKQTAVLRSSAEAKPRVIVSVEACRYQLVADPRWPRRNEFWAVVTHRDVARTATATPAMRPPPLQPPVRVNGIHTRWEARMKITVRPATTCPHLRLSKPAINSVGRIRAKAKNGIFRAHATYRLLRNKPIPIGCGQVVPAHLNAELILPMRLNHCARSLASISFASRSLVHWT
jgi:hypothetical protein